MSGSPFTEHRQRVLANVKGQVLEIGFGTGLNLAHYRSDQIESLTMIDPNPGMNALAQKRVEAIELVVNSQILKGENLPMEDDRFDSVVSTWTLCSIPQVEQALAEIYRVLKPGGQFFFIEHGLADDPKLQVWQHRLTPLQKVIADGCHLDRDIAQLIGQKFTNVQLETFYMENLPRIGSYMYQGIAQK